jgi:hypothetical protein
MKIHGIDRIRHSKSKYEINWNKVVKLFQAGDNGCQIAKKIAKKGDNVKAIATKVYRYLSNNGYRKKGRRSSYDHIDWDCVRVMYEKGMSIYMIARKVAKPENNPVSLGHRISVELKKRGYAVMRNDLGISAAL